MINNMEMVSAFKSLINSTKLAIFLTNKSGVITLLNSVAEVMFGYSSEELVLKQKSSLLLGQTLVSKIDVSSTQTYCGKFSKKNGTHFFAELTINSFFDDSGEFLGYLNIVIDLTEQKKMNLVVNELEVQLSSMVKCASVGEISATVAHEISNPLSIIQANTFFLIDNLKKKEASEESMMTYLKKVLNMCERLDKIIKRLRVISYRDEESYFDIVPINKISDNVMANLKERLSREGISLVVTIPEKELDIYCSDTKIFQVLVNLITNSYEAIKNLEDKWITVDFKLINNETLLQCSVTDSGKGIDSDLVEKIMQPFFSTKIRYQGAGLGLTVSRKILEKHGGHLYIDTKSLNTRFVFDIPIRYK